MRTLITLAISMLLASCGDYLTMRGAEKKPAAPAIDTTIPVLSENPGADISQYVLAVTKNAEIILPSSSTVTLADIETTSIFSLIRTPTIGSFSEGNIDNALVITLKALNVPNRTRVPFEITGITVADIEAMVLNGASVPVALAGYFDLGAQGATGYANLVIIFKSDQVTEGAETMTLKTLSSLANANISVSAVIDDTSRDPLPAVVPAPEYILRKIPNAAANEGNVSIPTTITLTTAGLPSGSTVPWTISGIDVDDIESMTVNGIPQTPALGGSFIVGGQGASGMVLIFKADQKTEGSETMLLALPNVSGTPTISVTINDTSMTPPVPPPPVLKYTLTKNPSANNIDEGNTGNVLSFRMSTENVPTGTQIPFTITGTGVTASDISQMVVNGNSVTPSLTGNFIIGQQGAPNYATVEIIFRNDLITEGDEILIFSTPGLSGITPISVTIKDASVTPPTDVIAPVITLSRIGTLTATNTISFGGSAADNIAVTSVKWINRTSATEGNATVTVYGNIVSWSADVPVIAGVNDVDFKVFDAVGLNATTSATVNGPVPPAPPVVADVTPPTIIITEQTGMDSSGVITVYGRATDNIGVTAVSWTRAQGGVGSATGVNGSGNTAWFASVTLSVGANVITFKAVDAAGNFSTVVLSQDVVGSGQTSFEGPPAEATPEPEVEKNQYMPGMPDDMRFRQLGINSAEVVDLSNLNIPEPPAEVHPCNRGFQIHLPDNALMFQNFDTYKNFSLLVSGTHITTNADIWGNISWGYGPTIPEHVKFFWMQRIGEYVWGAYDTGVTADNSGWNLGRAQVKLNTGYWVGSYNFAQHFGVGALPASRTEPCTP